MQLKWYLWDGKKENHTDNLEEELKKRHEIQELNDVWMDVGAYMN